MECITLIGQRVFTHNDGDNPPPEVEDFDRFQELLSTLDLTYKEEEAERQHFLFRYYGMNLEPELRPEPKVKYWETD